MRAQAQQLQHVCSQLIMLTVIGLLVLIYWWVQATVEGSNEHDVALA